MSTYPADDQNCVEYDAVREEYHAACKCAPSECVIKATSIVTETPLSELPPLYGTVDGEALDDLLAHAEGADSEVSVTFTYCGHEVTIDSADDITIRPLTEKRPAVG